MSDGPGEESEREATGDPHRAGRKTNCTAEITQRFADLIANGNYFETVCAHLDIPQSRAYQWLADGEEGKDAPCPDADAYRRFRESVTRAETRAEMAAVSRLLHAGVDHQLAAHLLDEGGKPLPGVIFGDWRATAEFLGRRYRDRWSKTERTELSGSRERPVRLQHEFGPEALSDNPEAADAAFALAVALRRGPRQSDSTDLCAPAGQDDPEAPTPPSD
jgi:hypothetical protein